MKALYRFANRCMYESRTFLVMSHQQNGSYIHEFSSSFDRPKDDSPLPTGVQNVLRAWHSRSGLIPLCVNRVSAALRTTPKSHIFDARPNKISLLYTILSVSGVHVEKTLGSIVLPSSQTRSRAYLDNTGELVRPR